MTIETETDVVDDVEPGVDDQPSSSEKTALEELNKAKSNIGRALTERDKANDKRKKAEADLKAVQVELDALKAALGSEAHDVEGLSQRLEKLEQFEAGKLADEKVDKDELIGQGRRGAEQALQPKINALTAKLEEAEEKIAKQDKQLYDFRYSQTIENAVQGIVKPGYSEMVRMALEKHVKLNEDNELKCYDRNGDLAVDGYGSSLSLKEFVGPFLHENFKDLCVENAGAAAGSGSTKSAAKEVNPWAKGQSNLAQQNALIRDPKQHAKARRLMAEAGKSQAYIKTILSGR